MELAPDITADDLKVFLEEEGFHGWADHAPGVRCEAGRRVSCY